MKGSNSQPGRRTKDWANTKGELVCCVEAPPRHWKQQGRCVTARAGRQRAAPISAPETSILHQNVSRLSVAPTSSWDPGQLTSARGLAAWDQLPRGDTWHTWGGALPAHPWEQAARTGEAIKMQGPPGTVHLPSTWSPELLGPGKGTKRMSNQACALVEYLRTWTWVA